LSQKKPPTDGLTDGYARAKKKVSRGNITDGINPSEISTVITDGLSVGNYGIDGNCVATLCEIPTDNSLLSVGIYGMTGNCLATLCESPTDIIRR
jgi:repressor of nif and glnA expression